MEKGWMLLQAKRLLWIMQREPVVAPPAVHATNWPQDKHAQKLVEGTQLCGFELDGVAAGAFARHQNQMR
jgi:hypothetical protein